MKKLEVGNTIGSERNQLGEGPLWCHRDQCLYWVDILSAKVWKWSFQSDDLMHWDMPKKVSAVFTTDTHKLAVALQDEFA